MESGENTELDLSQSPSGAILNNYTRDRLFEHWSKITSFIVAWVLALAFFIYLFYLGCIAIHYFKTELSSNEGSASVPTTKQQSVSNAAKSNGKPAHPNPNEDNQKNKQSTHSLNTTNINKQENSKNESRLITHYLLMMTLFASVGLSLSLVALKFAFRNQESGGGTLDISPTTPSAEAVKIVLSAVSDILSKIK